jgi:hypothetical protein
MDNPAVPASTRAVVSRVLAFQVLYVILHFAYDWLPGPFTAAISAIDESVFQHMKIGFFAWVLVSLGEGIITRPAAFATFVSSRLLVAALGPSIFSMIWFLAPGLIGRLGSDAAEIVWANLVILASGIFMAKLEDKLSERPSRPFFVVLSLAYAAVFLFLALRFTASRPWVDLFAPPF